MVTKTKKILVTARRKGRNAPRLKKRAKHHKRRTAYEEISIPTEAPPWEREDWGTRKEEILTAAKEVVDLYERLGNILGEAAKSVEGYGHNRGPESLETRTIVLADEAKTKKGIEELKSELRLAGPRKSIIRRLLHVFSSLRGGAESIATQLKDKVIEKTTKSTTDAVAAVLASSLAKGLRHLVDLVSQLL